MATWTITPDLRVLHDAAGKRQDCGQAEEAILDEVEGWVAREAKAWDMVSTPHGIFVRQSDSGVN